MFLPSTARRCQRICARSLMCKMFGASGAGRFTPSQQGRRGRLRCCWWGLRPDWGYNIHFMYTTPIRPIYESVTFDRSGSVKKGGFEVLRGQNVHWKCKYGARSTPSSHFTSPRRPRASCDRPCLANTACAEGRRKSKSRAQTHDTS